MADVRHTEIFDCKPEQFFKLIQDYENYSEFLKDVKSCKVVEDAGERKKVEFNISIVKNFKYTSEHIERFPQEMSWKFLEGDLFKSMSGHWRLQEEGGKTKAEYYVEASFGLLVPKAMIKSVLSANLPAMMKAYHQRVEELYPLSERQKEETPAVEEATPKEESQADSNERVELDWDAEINSEKRGLSESVKQLFVSGLSSGFISEENLKQYVQDLKLPKDVLNQVLKGAQKSKDDLLSRVSGELTKMIRKIDIVKELTKLLRDHKISIHADIEFSPKKKDKTAAPETETTEIEH